MMLARGHLTALSDRALARLLLGLALVLVIGVPAFGAYYYFDRHPGPGPSLADRAVASAEAAVRAQPADVNARNALAAAYVSDKRFDDGVAQFGEALKLQPDSHAALLGRGLAYVASNRPALALADFERLVSIAEGGEMAAVDPQLEQAYYEIGAIQLSEGRAADAATALESALRIDGGDADALYAYGSALIETGHAGPGVEALRRAVTFVPTGWCDPYQAMVGGYTALHDADGIAYAGAMVAFCGGHLDAAAAQLKPLESGAFAVDAWLGLALVAAARGDSPAAVDYYQKVLAKEPQNTSALIGLGQLGGADTHAGGPSATPSEGR